MLPYQASGISGKSPEDGGGENELSIVIDEIGGIAAGEKLRFIANFSTKLRNPNLRSFFRDSGFIQQGFDQEKFGGFRVRLWGK
jgi:hypothetical protein